MEDIVQGSPEWHALRLGRVTASKVSDLIAKTKTGWGASRANYMAQLIAETLTGTPSESFTNAAMQWGTDHEAEAREFYEFSTDATVEQVAFVIHPLILDSGASPDGLVGADGLVEIKCPNTSIHIDMLLGQAVPSKYITQIQWQLACTGRQWCDFVSFDPRLPADMRLFIQRVPRDVAYIGELEGYVRDFLSEMEAKLTALRSLGQRKAA